MQVAIVQTTNLNVYDIYLNDCLRSKIRTALSPNVDISEIFWNGATLVYNVCCALIELIAIVRKFKITILGHTTQFSHLNWYTLKLQKHNPPPPQTSIASRFCFYYNICSTRKILKLDQFPRYLYTATRNYFHIFLFLINCNKAPASLSLSAFK